MLPQDHKVHNPPDNLVNFPRLAPPSADSPSSVGEISPLTTDDEDDVDAYPAVFKSYDDFSELKERRREQSENLKETLEETVQEALTGDDRGMAKTITSPYERQAVEKSLLGINISDEIVGNYQAWFVTDVMLQGRIYLTRNGLIFSTSLPTPSRHVTKASSLRKKSSNVGGGYTRYWFVLRQRCFLYFQNAEQPYFPTGIINLRDATCVEVEELENGEASSTFFVHTPSRVYTFKADNPNSAHEWVGALRKVIFLNNTRGDYAVIRIPWRNIVRTCDSTFLDLAKTIRFTTLLDKHNNWRDFLFAIFTDADIVLKHINALIRRTNAHHNPCFDADGKLDLEHSLLEPIETPVYETTPEPTYTPCLPAHIEEGYVEPRNYASSESDKHSYFDNTGPREVMSSLAQLPKELSSSIVHTLKNEILQITPSLRRSTSQASKLSASVNIESTTNVSGGTISGNVSPRLRGAGDTATQDGRDGDATMGDKPNSSGSAEANSSSEGSIGGITGPNDTYEDFYWRGDSAPQPGEKSCTSGSSSPNRRLTPCRYSYHSPSSDEEISCNFHHVKNENDKFNLQFRKLFSFPDGVGLIASYLCYFNHGGTKYWGELYISDYFVCFYRSRISGGIRMVLPLEDLTVIRKLHDNRLDCYQLELQAQVFEPYVFIFCQETARTDAHDTLLLALESLHLHQRTLESDGEVPSEREFLDYSLRQARISTYEQTLSTRLHWQLPPVIFDAHSDTINEIFLHRPKHSIRITMLTIGSRGDVQPYVALSQALMKEGHKCKIATHAEFKDFVEGYGIEHASIAGEPGALMELMIEHGSFSVTFLKEAMNKFGSFIKDLLESAWVACQGSDLLIESPQAMAGLHIAEALQIPYFRAFTMPWTRTRMYPHALMVTEQVGGSYNYLTYVMFDTLFWRGISSQVNKWRKEVLGLEKTNLELMGQQRVPFLYSVSPIVMVPPVDQPDWIHITGYWEIEKEDTFTPDPELVQFIEDARAAGVPLIYLGFGSIIVANARKMTRIVVEAIRKAGVRCILAKGWTSSHSRAETRPEPKLPPEIFAIESCPHDWLFPRVDACVHHGGCGTTGMSLRCGKPTVIKPFFGDQFFYAKRVEELSAGLYMRKLNIQDLTKAIITVTRSEEIRSRAAAVGEQISREHGVQTAVQCLYRELNYARSLIRKPHPNPNLFFEKQSTGSESSTTTRGTWATRLRALSDLVDRKLNKEKEVATSNVYLHPPCAGH